MGGIYDVSWRYLGDVFRWINRGYLGISGGCLGDIRGMISGVYLGDIRCISWIYLGDVFTWINRGYLGDILVISGGC